MLSKRRVEDISLQVFVRDSLYCLDRRVYRIIIPWQCASSLDQMHVQKTKLQPHGHSDRGLSTSQKHLGLLFKLLNSDILRVLLYVCHRTCQQCLQDIVLQNECSVMNIHERITSSFLNDLVESSAILKQCPVKLGRPACGPWMAASASSRNGYAIYSYKQCTWRHEAWSSIKIGLSVVCQFELTWTTMLNASISDSCTFRGIYCEMLIHKVA